MGPGLDSMSSLIRINSEVGMTYPLRGMSFGFFKWSFIKVLRCMYEEVNKLGIGGIV